MTWQQVELIATTGKVSPAVSGGTTSCKYWKTSRVMYPYQHLGYQPRGGCRFLISFLVGVASCADDRNCALACRLYVPHFHRPILCSSWRGHQDDRVFLALLKVVGRRNTSKYRF